MSLTTTTVLGKREKESRPRLYSPNSPHQNRITSRAMSLGKNRNPRSSPCEHSWTRRKNPSSCWWEMRRDVVGLFLAVKHRIASREGLWNTRGRIQERCVPRVKFSCWIFSVLPEPLIVAAVRVHDLREARLQDHTRFHLPDSDRHFECPEDGCSRKFWIVQHLKVYEPTHKGRSRGRWY